LNYHYIQGKIVPEKEAWVSPFDLGLLRGFGVFDFFKVLDGIPLFMEDHLARFANSCRLMGLDLPENMDTIRGLIIELIRLNQTDNGTIKIVLTGGISTDGFMPAEVASLFILTGRINFLMSETYDQQKAYKLKSLEYKRETPGIKSLNYLIPIQHWKSIIQEGYDDLLYVYQDSVSETSRANIFVITAEGKLITPSEDILPGVTRNHIIQMAEQFMPVEIRKVRFEEVLNGVEVFLTSTTKRLMPVIQIDDHKLQTRTTGSIAGKLYNELRVLEKKYMEEFKSLSIV
jgi:branched-chain amino acid aminotransferase